MSTSEQTGGTADENDAMSDDDHACHWQAVKLSDISRNAYMRLLALHLQEEEAATVMARQDAYADFFIESPTQQFHEYFGPWDRDSASMEVRLSRMAVIDRLRDPAAGDYPDFFVDSPRNGPPWHEKFLDKGPKVDRYDPALRLQAMRQSRVLDAFLRAQRRALVSGGAAGEQPE